jgi:hypothetical protein
MAKKEWMVGCKISGTCTVYVDAETREEAMRLVNDGDWRDCELNEWSVEEAENAEINK